MQSGTDLCLMETDDDRSIDYQNWGGHIAELSKLCHRARHEQQG